MLGGNTTATIQQKTASATDDLGEATYTWSTIYRLTGWLDMLTGDSGMTYKAKLEESSHVFMCDYEDVDINPEETRCVINSKIYEIQYVDNPMELNDHLEIYLKIAGGKVDS
jgi:head-tail adaptor